MKGEQLRRIIIHKHVQYPQGEKKKEQKEKVGKANGKCSLSL